MNVVFSRRKDAVNRREHGISLQRAERFDMDTALVIDDDSQDYGETRYIATGSLMRRCTSWFSLKSMTTPSVPSASAKL